MRNGFEYCLWGVILLCCLAGCSLTVHHKGGGGGQDWQASDTDEAVVMSEIDAAAGMAFDDGRKRAMMKIAAYPRLSSQAQVYLVKKAVETLTFDDSKREVFSILIQNPYFTQAGKDSILEHLDTFEFESSKSAIRDALDSRGTQNPLWEAFLRTPAGRHDLQTFHEKEKNNPIQIQITGEFELQYTSQIGR